MKKLLGKENLEIFIDVKAIFYWNYNLVSAIILNIIAVWD